MHPDRAGRPNQTRIATTTERCRQQVMIVRWWDRGAANRHVEAERRGILIDQSDVEKRPGKRGASCDHEHDDHADRADPGVRARPNPVCHLHHAIIASGV